VYQAGTLSGNPLATAAGLAVLDLLDDDAFTRLDATAARLAKGLHDAFDAYGRPAVLPRVGPLVGLFFTDVAPTDFDQADVAARNGRYPVVFHELLQRGVALAPGPYEILFPSLAHDDEVVDVSIAAAVAAAEAVPVS
jgi:glutamate-1-semialdehyde 2,1-aminomutase